MKKYALDYDGGEEKILTPEELEFKYDVLKTKLLHQCKWSELPSDKQAQALKDVELEISYAKVQDLSFEDKELKMTEDIEYRNGATFEGTDLF